jgi:integral membrane sensor domain MASE1
MFELLLISVALVFNFVIVKIKLEDGNYINAIVDVIVFIVIVAIMGSTLGGMVIAAIASALFSLYLIYKPVGRRYY